MGFFNKSIDEPTLNSKNQGSRDFTYATLKRREEILNVNITKNSTKNCIFQNIKWSKTA